MRFLFCTGASAAVEPEALTPEQLARLRTSNTAAKAAGPTYTEPPSPDSSDYEASEMTTQGQEELPDQPPPPLQMMSSAFPSSSSAHGAPLAPLAPLRQLGHSTATSTMGGRALPPLGRSSQVLPRLEGRAPLLEISAVGRSTNGDGNAATLALEPKTTSSYANLPPPSPLVRCATSNEVAAFVKPSGSAGFKERPRPLPAPSSLALVPVQLPPAAPATAPSMPGSSLPATAPSMPSLPTSLAAIPTLAAADMGTDGEAAAPATALVAAAATAPEAAPAAAPAIPPAIPSAAPAAPPPAAPAPAAAPKSALARPSSSKGSKGGGGRRLSFAAEEKEVFVYEAGQEPPIDDYKANMHALNEMRRRRDREALAQLSFAELVSELDASEGGEGLACLAPRRVDPSPGSWQRAARASAAASAAGGGSSAGQLTWGQLIAKPPI